MALEVAPYQLTGVAFALAICRGEHRHTMGLMIGGTLAVIVIAAGDKVGLLEPARYVLVPFRSPLGPGASARGRQFLQFRAPVAWPPICLETLEFPEGGPQLCFFFFFFPPQIFFFSGGHGAFIDEAF